MIQASTQHDRLVAALETVVIGDRSICPSNVTAGLEWQAGLLQTADACARGERLLGPRWQAHFQSLPSSAVALNALPYLWVMADAHGHHRGAVHRWIEDLELSPTGAVACEQLFAILCRQMGSVHSLSALVPVLPSGASSWHDSGSVVQALSLVVQSQGQLAVAVGLARHREWSAAAIALVGLLTGLTGGRAEIGAALRQRWLLDYCPALLDPWQGLDAGALAALAAALHCRWAGVSPPNLEPSFPLGLRV